METVLKSANNKGAKIAKAIENKTTAVPSEVFLWAAFGSIGISMTLEMLGKKNMSLFIGQWVPTFLILGLYKKLEKLMVKENSERES